MNKVDMVKAIGEGVVSIGVLAIVKNVIVATTPPTVQPLVRGCIAVGSWIVADMVSSAAVNHTEKKINQALAQVKEVLATPAEAE